MQANPSPQFHQRGSAFAVLPAGSVPRSAEVHVIDQLVESEAPTVQPDVQN